jgi:ubiquitin-conjugating enzyme (huntingtin interacting protein 2)
MDKGRISKEFRDMEKHGKDSPVNASLVGDDLTHWKGSLRGPVRTVLPTIQRVGSGGHI